MRAEKNSLFAIFALTALVLTGAGSTRAQNPPAPAAPPAAAGGDIPADFKVIDDANDYIKRNVMISMRDGVKLNTVIIIPKGATHAPIILDRTPYNADKFAHTNDSPHRAMILPNSFGELSEAGYIIVSQDVRGKYKSEGDYVMTRPLSGELNPTPVDHSTDAWDTIDWLVKNVPETNGKVATMGTSYDGFTVLMSLVNPHPALKAAAPFNPMVDAWTGDDWFHNGALRQTYADYIYAQTATKKSDDDWITPRYDAYETWLLAGSAAGMGKSVGMEQLPFWQRLIAHPAYDHYWSAQALDKILGARPLTVPTLIVHSQWDQEDIYGAQAVFAATHAPAAVGRENSFLVIGPWRHGGGNGEGSTLGAIKFDGDTGRWFRRNVLLPFFDSHLKDGAPKADIAVVTAFETGANVWRRYDQWPQSCSSGCPFKSRPLYLAAGATLSFDKQSKASPGFDEYVSDPAKPVTYRLRPIRPTYTADSTWRRWLVDDQRFAADRTDVLTYTSEVLKAPLRIAGQPIAHLFASTSGTDSDWVVKLIDVYPDEIPGNADMGSYQLPISMDILRGRYRDDPAHPTSIPSGKIVGYTLKLPHADHVFLPGHRIMVQVQSSWFPLYDRNPQTFVPNIFFAKPGDYVKATQRVFHKPDAASYIDLPVAP
ncbi:MAG TPA: CocE/NonD family hydrolase [Steroidobacteraceae bacterium]